MTQASFMPRHYPSHTEWENKARINTAHPFNVANVLIQRLDDAGTRTQQLDLSGPRPRLYLKTPPMRELPLTNITSRRVDHEVIELRAEIDGCEVMWAEFENDGPIK